ncbi:hypothetical protein, partial [Pseudomonas savastanoi]|uniref:hypothetical protein n=1 Tax=Pseudomonas savastanoi TaxID=29438 RepID=UPI001C82295D
IKLPVQNIRDVGLNRPGFLGDWGCKPESQKFPSPSAKSNHEYIQAAVSTKATDLMHRNFKMPMHQDGTFSCPLPPIFVLQVQFPASP